LLRKIAELANNITWKKEEYWFYTDGRVKHIPPKEVHRLEGPIQILELVRGSDDDIVRLEDDYGRV